jgi:hypothetical protein
MPAWCISMSVLGFRVLAPASAFALSAGVLETLRHRSLAEGLGFGVMLAQPETGPNGR